MTGSKRYTPQFMLLVAKEAEKARTCQEISRKYEIDHKTVKEWVIAYNKYGNLAFEPDGPERFKDMKIAQLEAV